MAILWECMHVWQLCGHHVHEYVSVCGKCITVCVASSVDGCVGIVCDQSVYDVYFVMSTRVYTWCAIQSQLTSAVGSRSDCFLVHR